MGPSADDRQANTVTDIRPPAEPARLPRRSRGLRLVGIVLAVSLLLLSTGLIWLVHDRNWVRQNIEHAITTISGHPFTIEGDFDYALGRNIEVHAEKIRWRRSSDDNAPPLLEIGRLSGAFDLWSLLRRPVRITAVRFEQTRLWLAWGETKGFNWTFRTATGGDMPTGERPSPLPLVIERAAVQDMVIHLRHPALTDELEILVTEAQHQQDAANRLVVSGAAQVEDRSLTLNGRIGPFPELAVGGAVDFDLSVVGPLGSLTASGSTASMTQLPGLQLAARLQAPSANDLAQRLKLPLDTEGNVDLEGKIDTVGERLQILAGGSFGEFQIDARLQTESLASLDGLEASVRSRGPSARALATLAGHPALPDAPYQLEVDAKRTAQGLELQHLRLDSSTLTVEASGIARAGRELRDIDLTLTAQGADAGVLAELFGLTTSATQPFRLRTAVVSHGRDRPDDVDARLEVGDATARLTGSLSEARDLAGSRLQFTLDTPRADQLAALFGAQAPRGRPLKIKGSLEVTPEQLRIDNLKASIAGTELTAQASLGRGPGPPVGILKAQAKGPDFAALFSPLLPPAARSALPGASFTAATELRMSDDGLRITTASLESGGNALAFQGVIDIPRPGVHLVGELSAKGDNLAGLFDNSGFGALGIEAFSLRSQLQLAPDALRFKALKFTARQADIEGSLSFVGENYAGVEFDLTGTGASLAALVPENAFYRPPDIRVNVAARGKGNAEAISVAQLEAVLGDTRLAFTGDLELTPRLAAKGFDLRASGPRLSDLGSFGAWRLTDRPFTLTAGLHGDAQQQRIERLEFVSGDNNLSGRLRFGRRARPVIEAELESTRLALDELRIAADHGTPKASTPREARLFPDDALPFELLDRFDGEIRVKVANLLAHNRLWRNVALDAVIDEGTLEIRRAQADAARGKVQLRGSVKPAAAGRRVTAHITAADAMLASEQMTPDELDRLPRHAIDARLSASGNTPHELAASLNGFVWMIGGEGESRRAKLAPLFGDFLVELATAINPLAAKETTSRVDCDGAYLEIKDGKVETAPAIVLQTERIIVFAVGMIDLADEKIDITFETTPLGPVGIGLGDLTNPFTKLTGTLRQPKIAVDPKGALLEGGAAVATAGLTIVLKGLWKRWFGSHKICERVGGEAVKLRTARDPGNVPDLAAMVAGTLAEETAIPAAAQDDPVPEKPRSNLEQLYDMMD